VEIVRVTGRALRLQPRTVVPDVKRKLALDVVQGSKENVKEDRPAERAEGVALGPPTSGDPGRPYPQVGLHPRASDSCSGASRKGTPMRRKSARWAVRSGESKTPRTSAVIKSTGKSFSATSSSTVMS
jgi:hypothetical protein